MIATVTITIPDKFRWAKLEEQEEDCDILLILLCGQVGNIKFLFVANIKLKLMSWCRYY